MRTAMPLHETKIHQSKDRKSSNLNGSKKSANQIAENPPMRA